MKNQIKKYSILYATFIRKDDYERQIISVESVQNDNFEPLNIYVYVPSMQLQ